MVSMKLLKMKKIFQSIETIKILSTEKTGLSKISEDLQELISRRIRTGKF